MQCVICKNGNTKNGLVTVTLEKNGSIILIKDVPAMICNNCGDYYLSEEATKAVLKLGKSAMKKGVELEITRLETAGIE